MNRRLMNRIFYVVSLLCLFAGTMMGIGLIWLGFDHVMLWQGIATTGAVFLASVIALAINAAFVNTTASDDRYSPRHPRRFEDDDDRSESAYDSSR